MCLIPEVSFNLQKLKEHVASILAKKGHAVVCVAEGAGQVRARIMPRCWGSRAQGVVSLPSCDVMHSTMTTGGSIPQCTTVSCDVLHYSAQIVS